MIYAKNNPIGVDFPIDRMQRRLDEKLTWANTDIYGRVYLNTKSNGKIVAEAYVGNNSYKDVFVNKSKSAIIGFVETGEVEYNKIQTSNIDIVCTVILDKIYTSALRNDEEALQEVVRIVSKTPGWEIIKIRKRNVKEVFRFMDTSNIMFRDMQPYANFAISCKVNYMNNICNF